MPGTVPIKQRLCFLYPGYASEHDYPYMASAVVPAVEARVVHTEVPEDAHRPDALRRIGAMELLVAPEAKVRAFAPDAITWACTSGSFVFGRDGARRQVEKLEEAYQMIASSTALAFLSAIDHLGIERVSIAASYPEDVSQLFADYVTLHGVKVEAVDCLDIITGVEVGALEPEEIINFVATHAVVPVDAVLVPDTAMPSARFLEELEGAAGTRVLTANQVTMWDLLRRTGWRGEFPRGGSLFAVT